MEACKVAAGADCPSTPLTLIDEGDI
jgi:hypothetical protein